MGSSDGVLGDDAERCRYRLRATIWKYRIFTESEHHTHLSKQSSGARIHWESKEGNAGGKITSHSLLQCQVKCRRNGGRILTGRACRVIKTTVPGPNISPVC